MELYLLRHGAAEENNPKGDAARELTAEGREKVAAVIRTARRGGMNPSLILSSPYIRARQTAAYAGEFTVLEALVPYGRPEAVWSGIRDFGSPRSVLLASHEPLVGTLAAWLLASPTLQMEVKKAALIRIDVASVRAEPHGVLRWMLTPAVCD